MIVHLLHHQIDPDAWDRRLASASNAAWYGSRAALDAAAPGWNALVDEESGAQMPLPWRMKYGVRYLYQPFMLQHVGPYMPEPSDRLVGRFLEAIPRGYRYADICVQGGTAVQAAGLRTEVRTNHVLELGHHVEELRSRYSTSHRRSVQKAARMGVTVLAAPVEEVAAFIEGSDQFRHWGTDGRQRAAMRRIMTSTGEDGSGFGRTATMGGDLLAAGWFVRGPGEVVFLKGVSSPRGREVRAMHALIDAVIAEQALAGRVFDLAGGNDPQLARFYSGFGALPVFYLRALMNRLPVLIRRLKP